jgi:hypothetical protein
MKNKIEDVRNHLVAQMEALNADEVDPSAIERAKAMSGVATAYINAVKVELDAIRLMDEVGQLPNSITPSIKFETRRPELGGAR